MAGLHKPDVILMDLMMPGVDGITATREIHQKYPQIKVIALTSFSEQNMVQGALQAEAAGYLQKNVTATELGSAIRSAYAGRMTLSPEAAQALAQSVTQSHLPGNELTERERDVLRCMVDAWRSGTRNLHPAAQHLSHHAGGAAQREPGRCCAGFICKNASPEETLAALKSIIRKGE
jgi:CheY-like chemotaxis protein